jgi:hypothetical protein
MEPSWHVLGPEPARVGPAPGQYRNQNQAGQYLPMRPNLRPWRD